LNKLKNYVTQQRKADDNIMFAVASAMTTFLIVAFLGGKDTKKHYI